MDSAPKRAKRLESVISICLLMGLFLMGVVISVKQFDYNINQPSSLAPVGFETFSKPETYTEENLYEKINGKAPLYIESGFRKLLTQRFVSKDDQNLWMELFLFDMGTAKNAFAVYSVQRRPDAETLQTMQFAYKTTNALYFAIDKYYVELVGSAESQKLLEAMLAVAEKTPGWLGVAKDTEIAELRLFPQENIVPDSFKLHSASAFGFEGLTDTFTTRYIFDGSYLTAFLSGRQNAQDAQLVAESYYKFLINNGGVDKPLINKDIEAKVVEFYGTTEIIFTTGPFLAGMHEAQNQQLAEELAVKLIDKLSEAAKAQSDE